MKREPKPLFALAIVQTLTFLRQALTRRRVLRECLVFVHSITPPRFLSLRLVERSQP